MTATKHTPGPWQRADTAHPGRGYGNSVIGPHGEIVGSWNPEVWSPDRGLGAGSAEGHREAEANANLLEAAPDLLEACEALMDALESTAPGASQRIPNPLQGTRAAIAKAKGGAR